MSVLKENIRYHAMLYLISPVLGLIYGIRSKSWTYIRWSIFVFTVIYGSLLTFGVMGGQRGVNKGADGAIHLNNVYSHYQYLDFVIWWKELIAILSLNPQNTQEEPYFHILAYLVGSFLNIPGAFFVFVAIVYGYFYSGAIVKLLTYVDWKKKHNKFYYTFFLIMLLMWINFIDMQTVRTWTGMWVLVYAVISYHQTKKKKYLVLVLIPPFIHIGFAAMAIPVWLVLFSGFRNPKVYFIIFMISTLFANVTEQAQVFDQVAQTSEVSASKVRAYSMTEKRVEDRKQSLDKSQSNFYKKYGENLIQYQVLTGIIIFIFLFLRNIGFSKFEDTLFSYGLALASFANFTSYIYALHNRTWNIATIFILALLVIFLSKNNLRNIRYSSFKVKLPLNLFILLFIPYLFLKFSMLLNLSSSLILIAPFIGWINPEIGINIRDFIVFLL